jgi:hypothetical protein
MKVVADTGPLVALAKINALDLLTCLYGPVMTAPTVFTEAVTAGLAQNAPDAHLLDAAYTSGALQVRTPTVVALPRPALVHHGEEESIRLAIDLSADWLLVDDLGARKAALDNFSAAGVPTAVKGTLGVLVTAYQARHVTQQQAVDLVNLLKARPDIWINSKLCDQVIRALQRD